MSNQAPVVQTVYMNMREDGIVVIDENNLLAYASDPDLDSLSITSITSSFGNLVNNLDGTWSFTPPENFNGQLDLTFEVSDTIDTTSQSIHLNVLPVNDAPSLENITLNMQEDGSVLISERMLIAGAQDIDGDLLSLVSISSDNGSLFSLGNGYWAFTPNPDFNGTLNLTYEITDGYTNVNADLTINVAAFEDEISPLTYDMDEDAALVIYEADLLAYLGSTEELSITNITSSAGTLVNNHDGSWTYTPPSDYNGSLNLSFTATDINLSNINEEFVVNVAPIDDVPVADIVNMSMDEDKSLIIKASDLLAYVTDVDGDGLEIISVTVDPLQGQIIESGPGVWTFVPNENFNGIADLEYEVSDYTTNVNQVLNVTVSAVNDILTLIPPADESISENASLIITEAQLLADAFDIDGDNLSIVSVTTDHGTIVDNLDGTWTYTPPNGYTGQAQISYTVTDGVEPVSSSFDVTVNNTIVAPLKFIINNISTATPDYYAANNYTIQNPGTYPFSTTLTGSAIATSGISSNVRINESFTGQNTASLNLTTGTVRNVYAVSETNGSVTLNNFIRHDVSLGGTGNSTVTLTNGSRGSINTNDGNDTINITAKNALDSYGSNYQVNSGAGSDTISVSGGTNSVFNLNSGIGNDTVTISGNYASSTVNAGDGNDTVTTGASADVINAGSGDDSINAGGGNDTITGSGGSDTIDGGAGASDKVIFSGNLNEYVMLYNSGTATFTISDLVQNRDSADSIKNVELFQFNDGTYTAAQLQAFITGGSINHIPAAPEVDMNVNEDDTIIFNQSLLLAGATDSDGNTLSVTSVSNPSGIGTLTDLGGGDWQYTPPANYNGMPVLSFTVSDGTNQVTSQINMTVNPINDAPDGSINPITMNENDAILLYKDDILANITDIDSDNLSILSITTDNGTISDNGNGSWTFVPDANYIGSVNLVCEIYDGELTVNKTLAINVEAFEGPTEEPITLLGTEDEVLVIDGASLLSMATELSGTLELVSITTSQGSLVNNNDGTWSYTPPTNFNGIANLSYTVTNGTDTVNKALKVDVEPVNDAPISTNFSLNMIANSAMIISQAELFSHLVDADGDQLEIVDTTTTNGDFVQLDNGDWAFVPAANFHGTVHISFTATDGEDSTTSNLTINVEEFADNLKFTVNNNLEINNTHNYAVPSSYTDADDAQVTAEYSAINAATIGLDVVGTSGVSSVDATSHNAADLVIDDFNHVNVQLGNGGDSDIEINNATSGNINTGDGEDAVNVTLSHTPDLENNQFNINTSYGNDTINIIGNNDNLSAKFNINTGDSDDTVTLSGKYANATIVGGGGNDTVYGGDGNDLFVFTANSGTDTFSGGAGSGWQDSIMVNSNSSISITQNSSKSWTLIVDGQEAQLTTDVAGTVVDNHIDFAGSATGTLTLTDGSSVNFDNIEHVEW